MDLNKLSQGDIVIGISAILLFIFSFFSWLGAKVTVAGHTVAQGSDSAWGFTLTLLAVLLGLVLLAYVVMKALGIDIPNTFGSVTLAQIILGVAAVAFLFVLIKLIAGPNLSTGSFSVNNVTSGVSKTRKVGIFLGLLATIGLVAGAFLNFQESKA